MKKPEPWTVGNWLALIVPSSLVDENCTRPRSTLSPTVRLLLCPKTLSDVAAWTVPPKLLVLGQVRSIAPNTLGDPSAPALGTFCPRVVVRLDTEPSRLGKHSSVGSGQTVGSFDASVPLPSTWLWRKLR